MFFVANKKNRNDSKKFSIIEIFQNFIFARRIFIFNDKMYNVSSHYFRLFKQLNLHSRLFDSNIQNIVKKITFQINLKRELNDFDQKNVFFSNIKKTFFVIIFYKNSSTISIRKFKSTNHHSQISKNR